MKAHVIARFYQWTVPGDTDPEVILADAEATLGLKLCHRPGDPEQHGFLETVREGDVRYVLVGLYPPCDDPECPTGHGNKRDPKTKKIVRPAIRYVRADDPSPQALAALRKGPPHASRP